MYKAVIFDFDGTIADTMEQNYQAWKYALDKYGYVMDEAKYYHEEGRTPRAIVSDFTEDNDTLQDIMNLKEMYFIKNYKFKIYDGVLELLNKLKNNTKIALVTGGAPKRIEHILQESGLKDYFDLVITANDVTKGKPDKEPYEIALARLCLNASECIVIENAPMGIESAKGANIFCIALQTTLTKDKLEKADL
ncbi:MAG: HAD family phosphatase, partial [Campylobacteraceae bacterium]|nr:HAD family phosphatase [Campylobacteraceae bacterium]